MIALDMIGQLRIDKYDKRNSLLHKKQGKL